jgi:hypothetical protein
LVFLFSIKVKIIYSFTTKEAAAEGTLIKVEQDILSGAGIKMPLYQSKAGYGMSYGCSVCTQL